jgi:transposase
MAGDAAAPLVLPKPLREELKRLSCSATAERRLAERAQIIALACEGLSNAQIARQVGCTAQTAAKWRRRMAKEQKRTALKDLPRSGRPAEVPVTVRCEVIKQACDRPKDTTFRQIWTLESLSQSVAATTEWKLSRSEISRILSCEGIRPHQVRMWLHSPDPDFTPKVGAICDVYLNPPAGATVLCIDEKPGMQALERLHPTHYSCVSRAVRHEFEYRRHGTSTLIAAFNTRTGKVFGQCRRRTAKGLVSFMEALAKQYPTGPIYVIWDNLNIHKGKRWHEFNERHGSRFHFLHTPLHASWVNQIELWFSILQRRVLKHASFCCIDELNRAVLGFIKHWNRIEAHPFHWTFRGTCRTVQQLAA